MVVRKMKRFVLLFFFSLATASENLPSPKGPLVEERIVFPTLRGVLLLGRPDQVRLQGLEDREGVSLDGVDLPGSPRSLDEALGAYWGKPLSAKDIAAIKRIVARYYRDKGRPVVQIQVPSQPVESGVLQLVVWEIRLGEIRVVGNRYFSSKRLSRMIRVDPERLIWSDRLAEDLNWINRNPFRSVDLIFVPSPQEGYADFELVARDQFPLRFYAGVDNTGIAQSGHNRWFTGFNWGDCFFLDHLLNYQFTSGSQYNEFWSHSASYTAPLSWRHILEVYGGYSKIKAEQQGSPRSTTRGTSGQTSLRYEVPLPSRRFGLDEIFWGFDWKYTNNNISQRDEIIMGSRVNLSQLVFGVGGGGEARRVKTFAILEFFASPGQWLPDQENSHFNDLRLGAKNTYLYGRLALSSIVKLPYGFTLDPMLRCQLASANLLSSEQFSLGGFNSVRGYEEREVNVDNGLIFNLELRTPPLSLFSLSENWKRKGRDQLRFLLFFDYGYGQNHKRFDGEKRFPPLMGVGPGLRYAIEKYLSLRVDYGWNLHHAIESISSQSHMLYFGLVVSI